MSVQRWAEWEFERTSSVAVERIDAPAGTRFVNDVAAKPMFWQMLNEYTEPILIVENTETPTPEYYRDTDHLEYHELVARMSAHSYYVDRSTAVDWIYRRWLEDSPPKMLPMIAYMSLLVDVIAARFIKPKRARHTATLFTRGD